MRSAVSSKETAKIWYLRIQGSRVGRWSSLNLQSSSPMSHWCSKVCTWAVPVLQWMGPQVIPIILNQTLWLRTQRRTRKSHNFVVPDKKIGWKKWRRAWSPAHRNLLPVKSGLIQRAQLGESKLFRHHHLLHSPDMEHHVEKSGARGSRFTGITLHEFKTSSSMPATFGFNWKRFSFKKGPFLPISFIQIQNQEFQHFDSSRIPQGTTSLILLFQLLTKWNALFRATCILFTMAVCPLSFFKRFPDSGSFQSALCFSSDTKVSIYVYSMFVRIWYVQKARGSPHPQDTQEL